MSKWELLAWNKWPKVRLCYNVTVWSTRSDSESHPAVVSPGKIVNPRQQSLFGKQAKLHTWNSIVMIIKTTHYFSQRNAVHVLPTWLYKIHFNSDPTSFSGSSHWSFKYHNQNSLCSSDYRCTFLSTLYYISLICDESVTTQNLAFLSYWSRKKRLQMHF
jgi:hypothetical protein